mmetsp:Transcript_7354/g.21385  ORF Transcript_7354/g.21385 Transcript_7354/m.21385 type:complete len:341 (+) Transcript_7354:251-1273(+)
MVVLGPYIPDHELRDGIPKKDYPIKVREAVELLLLLLLLLRCVLGGKIPIGVPILNPEGSLQVVDFPGHIGRSSRFPTVLERWIQLSDKTRRHGIHSEPPLAAPSVRPLRTAVVIQKGNRNKVQSVGSVVIVVGDSHCQRQKRCFAVAVALLGVFCAIAIVVTIAIAIVVFRIHHVKTVSPHRLGDSVGTIRREFPIFVKVVPDDRHLYPRRDAAVVGDRVKGIPVDPLGMQPRAVAGPCVKPVAFSTRRPHVLDPAGGIVQGTGPIPGNVGLCVILYHPLDGGAVEPVFKGPGLVSVLLECGCGCPAAACGRAGGIRPMMMSVLWWGCVLCRGRIDRRR